MIDLKSKKKMKIIMRMFLMLEKTLPKVPFIKKMLTVNKLQKKKYRRM